jgi:thymidylate synthase
MRSNDAILGTATDVAFFCTLQVQMWKLLRRTYPDLELGSYTHFVHSMHIYERHFEMVKEMLDEEFISIELLQMQSDFVDKTGKASEFIEAYIQHLEAGNSIPSSENNSLEQWITKNLTTGS